MKKTTMGVLLELLKDSSKSDRKLAKILGVSQPTVSRTRSRLAKDGVIKEFTVIPDLSKMGFEILAVNCFRTRISKKVTEMAKEKTKASPNIIFASRCQGGGKTGIVMSLHRNYTDYSKFISKLLAEGGDDIEENETYLISLKDYITKPFSLKHIAELYEKQ